MTATAADGAFEALPTRAITRALSAAALLLALGSRRASDRRRVRDRRSFRDNAPSVDARGADPPRPRRDSPLRRGRFRPRQCRRRRAGLPRALPAPAGAGHRGPRAGLFLPASRRDRADPARHHGAGRRPAGRARRACGLFHDVPAADGRAPRGAGQLVRSRAQLRRRAHGRTGAGPRGGVGPLSGRGSPDRRPGRVPRRDGRRVHRGRARHGGARHTGDARPRRSRHMGAGGRGLGDGDGGLRRCSAGREDGSAPRLPPS